MMITFPKGLPGFEDYRKFELRKEPEAPGQLEFLMMKILVLCF